MNKLFGLVVVGSLIIGAGCKGKRIAECDAFVTTAEKIAACDKIPEAQRKQMKDAAEQMKKGLDLLSAAGDDDKAVIDEMRSTCREQHKTLTDQMNEAFPDCLK